MLTDALCALAAVMFVAYFAGGGLPIWQAALVTGVWWVIFELWVATAIAAIRRVMNRE